MDNTFSPVLSSCHHLPCSAFELPVGACDRFRSRGDIIVPEILTHLLSLRRIGDRTLVENETPDDVTETTFCFLAFVIAFRSYIPRYGRVEESKSRARSHGWKPKKNC